MLNIVPPSETSDLPLEITSNVSYELHVSVDSEGSVVPVQMGSGKFAKVFRAMQRSTGRDIQPVAIKVLHDYSDLQAERLFEQREIELLKDLTEVNSVNVVQTLDIISLGPLLLCGCGQLYHPSCPRCGKAPLRRRPPELSDVFPVLHCAECKFEISAEHIQKPAVIAELRRYPAKRCCRQGINANKASLINFAERKALVMEQLDALLDVFGEARRRYLKQASAKVRSQRQPLLSRLWDQLLRPLATRVQLLEKVFLMVQLAEAVTWLHSEKEIVHKDLAPDNLMLKAVGGAGLDDAGDSWRGPMPNLRTLLNNLASYPTFGLKVIDFGLADQGDLSRSWYEEDGGQLPNIKIPYLSPEASPRSLRLGAGVSSRILFDLANRRFRVPPDLEALPGDILADANDRDHLHDLRIVELVQDGEGRYAVYEGDLAHTGNPQYVLVRGLGEAHDIYAVGAVFYFILTESHEEVRALGRLVGDLQEERARLRWPGLRLRRSYRFRRKQLREPFWQDQLLQLILRAMVRGSKESYVRDRTERGPRPAQALLRETKRIYHGLQREILATPLLLALQILLLVAVVVGLAVGLNPWRGSAGADRSQGSAPAADLR